MSAPFHGGEATRHRLAERRRREPSATIPTNMASESVTCSNDGPRPAIVLPAAFLAEERPALTAPDTLNGLRRTSGRIRHAGGCVLPRVTECLHSLLPSCLSPNSTGSRSRAEEVCGCKSHRRHQST